MAIAEPTNPLAREALAEAGFKPDTLYMEVPRCDLCRHWVSLAFFNGCQVLGILTESHFGCVEWAGWEAKG